MKNQPPEKCFPHYTPPVEKKQSLSFCIMRRRRRARGIRKKEFRKIFDFPPMQNGRNKVKYLIEN